MTNKPTLARAVLMTTVAFLVTAGCGDDPSTATPCEPGVNDQKECVCADGAVGIQTCANGGPGWAPCDCDAPGIGGTSGTGGTTDSCSPGTIRSCTGPGDCPGTQTCNASGTGYGTCTCTATGGTGGGITMTGSATGGPIMNGGGVAAVGIMMIGEVTTKNQQPPRRDAGGATGTLVMTLPGSCSKASTP